MIRIHVPGITQEEFQDAFAVLEECKVTNLPCLGFVHPFMGPGGQYGQCWWERDSMLTLNGYCWLNQEFSEKALENFIGVQKENGRIPLYGYDLVDPFDAELSAIPVIFDAALRICRRTTDRAYIFRIYTMLKRYMEWWQSSLKRDEATGLCCGIFEESDPSDFADQLTAAQVDLNVQVCVGADVLREMAEYLGEDDAAARWRALFCELRDAINRWLYCEKDGAYYTRLVKENRLQTERVYNSMFDVFKRGIVPAERHSRLLALLKDDSKFGYDSQWGITTMAKDCREYTETVGAYQGYTSWSGNIWTFRSEIIITGLMEAGYREEAAHLAWQMVRTFNGNYAEFVSPSTGEGHGVLRYGWSASQYIEVIIEVLFGIRYNAWTDTLTVCPNIPAELMGQPISIDNVSLGNGEFVHVCAERTEAGISVSWTRTDREK